MSKGRSTTSHETMQSLIVEGESAISFRIIKDAFNVTGAYPFPLTDSQFLIVMCEHFAKSHNLMTDYKNHKALLVRKSQEAD